MVTYDGHIHTPFCPHGSMDELSEYIERAISNGFTGLTFTEHAPLPEDFTDPAPTRDSCMKADDFNAYIESLIKVQEIYKKKITINIGLEVDYIIGYESSSKRLLDEIGPYLDDSILSVHFLQKEKKYYCMDYSAETFKEIVKEFGGLHHVYDSYFQTVTASILSDLGIYKPKRIGHITLVNKFQKKFDKLPDYSNQMLDILNLVKEKNYELDYNGAGVVKPDCGEPYPPSWVVKEAQKRKIPLVYGSDAHTAKGIGQGLDGMLLRDVTFSSPL
jgi:histidinol-phosphatase (PHP family)